MVEVLNTVEYDEDGRRVPVVRITSRTGRFTVYNFEVEPPHTYYAAGWWVHNQCPISPQFPGEYLARKAPQQVTPRTRVLDGVYIDDLGRAQPWKAYYDEFGRLEARTDFNAENKAAEIPDTHHHTYVYRGGRQSGTWQESGSHLPGTYKPR